MQLGAERVLLDTRLRAHFAAHIGPHTQCMVKAVNNYSSPLDTLSDPVVTFSDMRRGEPILAEVEGKQTVPQKKKRKRKMNWPMKDELIKSNTTEGDVFLLLETKRLIIYFFILL